MKEQLMAWRVANSLLKLRDQVNTALPDRNKDNDGTIGDAAHASRSSDHNPWVKEGSMGIVTAMDITHDPKHGLDSYKFAEYLRQTKDPRIKYVISNKRIFSFEVQPWQWRPYHGSNPHNQHVHISVRELKSLYDWDKPWLISELAPDHTADPVPDHPILKKGSKGRDVLKLQQLLKIPPEFTEDPRSGLTKAVQGLMGTGGFTPEYWFGPFTDRAVRDFQTTHELHPDGIVGPYTWRALEGSTSKKVLRNVVATVFGGEEDPNKSAYTGKLLNDTDYYVALPYRFTGVRPKVKVTNRHDGTSVVATVEDIGPWNINDPYWTKVDGRPQAESGHDMTGRSTNAAGIDLSPAVAKALSINGKSTVDWEFA